MNVLFLQTNNSMNLSYMYLSSMLKKEDYSCDVLIVRSKTQLENYLLKHRPLFICASICSWCFTNSDDIGIMKFLDYIKNKFNVTIIVGGTTPTLYPEQFIRKKCIDIVCTGESEFQLLELFESLIREKKNIIKIDGLWIKKNGKIYKNPARKLIYDINILPFPDRTLYKNYPKLYEKVFNLISARGCPHSCTFCINHLLKSSYKNSNWYRMRNPKNVVAEMVHIKNKFSASLIYFCNEVFPIDKEWLSEFVKLTKKKSTPPFICQLHGKCITRDNIIKFHQAGCKGIRIGIESYDSKIRRDLYNKDITNEALLEISKLLKNFNIKFFVHVLISGLREDAQEEFYHTVDFCRKLSTTYTRYHCLVFLKGTRLYEQFKKYNPQNMLYFLNPKIGGYTRKLITAGNVYEKHIFFRPFIKLLAYFLPLRIFGYILLRRLIEGKNKGKW